jgi:hypothetical protein
MTISTINKYLLLFIACLSYAYIYPMKEVSSKRKTRISTAYGPPKLRYKAKKQFNKPCNSKNKNAILLKLTQDVLALKYQKLALLMSQERPDADEIWKECVQAYGKKKQSRRKR